MSFKMSGSDFAKSRVVSYLKRNIGDYIRMYESEYGGEESWLIEPHEDRWYKYDASKIDAFPMMFVVITRTNSITRIGYTDNFDPEYRCEYATRVYVWDKGIDAEDAVKRRDVYMNILRMCLLDDQSLSEYSELIGNEVVFDEGTMIEEYSDVVNSDGPSSRAMAGGFIGFNMTIVEVLERKPLSVDNATFEVEVDRMDWDA